MFDVYLLVRDDHELMSIKQLLNKTGEKEIDSSFASSSKM